MFEEAVVGFFVEAAEILGVPKSVAVIYGLCFASPEPLSFVDFNERLDISQGSISQGLRVLREFGALRVVQPVRLEVRLSGSEAKLHRSARCREFYIPDLKLREFAVRWIEQQLERRLHAGNIQLRAMFEAVPPVNQGTSKELMSRLKYLENWHQQSQALLPIIKAFLKHT